MTANPYSQASSAYLQTRDENMDGMEIVLECYKGIIRFLREAKAAYGKDDLEKMCYWVERALKVIESLHANLDMNQGGKDAEFLHEFYVVLIGRSGKILDRPDVNHEFDQLIAYIQPVYEQWYKLTTGNDVPNYKDEAEPSIEEAEMVSDEIH